MTDNAILVSVAGALTVIVGGYAYLLKRKNGSNGNGHDEHEVASKIRDDIARIDEKGISMPESWRGYIDDRIAHKLRNVASFMTACAELIHRGLPDRAEQYLREEARHIIEEADRIDGRKR